MPCVIEVPVIPELEVPFERTMSMYTEFQLRHDPNNIMYEIVSEMSSERTWDIVHAALRGVSNATAYADSRELREALARLKAHFDQGPDRNESIECEMRMWDA